jgi:hypothetical protein
LPVYFVVKHGVENNEELAHTGDERELGLLAIGTQSQTESSIELKTSSEVNGGPLGPV